MEFYALKLIRRIKAKRSSAEEKRLKRLKRKAKPIRNKARREMQEALNYGYGEDELVDVLGCLLPLSELKLACAHLDLLRRAQSWRGAEVEFKLLPKCWQDKFGDV